MRLSEKTCVVTGGASGIGEAIVRRFADEGALVLIADLNEDDAKALADELGDSVISVRCDVRSAEDAEAAAAAALDAWGRVDVLVNNAGTELSRTYDEMSVAEWDKVLDTDLKGPWLMCKHIVPHMVERSSGSVINISSLNGLVGFPLSTAYGSAKGGLVMFTKDMAIELASSGVRFNCICPGVIQTPMMERWADLQPDSEAAKQLLIGAMPIGRLGRPEEVAAAVLFFASEDSTLCQGSVLSVDGGFVAQ